MILSTRKTKVLSVDEYLKIDVMNFAQLRFIHPLKPATGRPIDIGAIAYSRRQQTKDITVKELTKPTFVDLSSFRKERLFFISNLRNELINKRPATQHVFFQMIFRVINWLDNNNYEDCFSCPEKLHNAYFSYTNYLIDRVLIEGHLEPLNVRCAKDYQWGFRKIIPLIFPDQVEKITAGVRVLKGKSEPAQPISTSYIEKYWRINYEIFIKFSAQCFSNNAFPPLIQINEINSYYFPFMTKFIRIDSTHTHKQIKISNKNFHNDFDYKSGKFLGSTSHANKLIKKNKKHNKRIEMGIKAKNCFIQLFRILTRINNSDLMRLKYEENYEIKRNKTSQEFYSIKYRAGNKEITFRLEIKGYALFKKYLKLRKWLLNGDKCNYLFFSLGRIEQLKPKILSSQINYNHHYFLIKQGFISSDSKALRDQQIRNLNTVFLRNDGYSSKGIADNNNHTVESSESFYSVTSQEQQVQELDLYWQAIQGAEKHISTLVQDNHQPTTTGTCSSANSLPDSLIDKPPIIPNCKIPQGCLFCKHYVCHADKEDIKKLLSLLFIALEIVKHAVDIEPIDNIYNKLIVRIEFILSKISLLSDKHSELVTKLRVEVLDDAVLTDFWDKRLDFYIDMGLINL